MVAWFLLDLPDRYDSVARTHLHIRSTASATGIAALAVNHAQKVLLLRPPSARCATNILGLATEHMIYMKTLAFIV